MKKRLLSAALALAMVLTLLPATTLTASAADATDTTPESGKTSVQWINGTDYSKLKKDGTSVANGWAWQYKDPTDAKTYWTVGTLSDGIVNGTNASGVYYAEADMYNVNATTGAKTLKTTSFTLVGSLSSFDPQTATSLSVNLFGSNLTFDSGKLNTVNSLTITDTKYSTYGGTAGTLSGISRDVGTYTAGTPATTMSASGLTLNVTGATVDSINLVGRGNRVTLTDARVTGAITLDGTTAVTAANGTTTTTYPAQNLTINPRAAVPYTKSSVGGAISVTGNGSVVALNGTTSSGAVNVTSTGGSLTLSNGTTVGAITVTSGADRTSTSAPASVTVNDATAGGYTYGVVANNTASSSLIVNAQGKVTGAISTNIGTVAIHSANVGDVTVKAGTLTVDGANGTLGNITLGDDTTASKVTWNFSGTGYTGGNIKAGAAATLTIGNNWPAGRSNTFGTIDLKNYTGQGIKGGIFGSKASDDAGGAKSAWFSPELQFMRETASSKYAYYGIHELAAAIADAGTDAKTAGKISVIGYLANGATAKEAEFYNSLVDVSDRTKAVALLTYGASTAIYLPNMINGSAVATWTDASDGALSGTNTSTAKTYGVNELVSLSSQSKDVKFVLQSSGAAVTRLTNATASGNNKNVTVTMSGNQIVLSGAVGQAAFEDVEVTCTTDLVGTGGGFVTFPVVVSFNTTTKVATISTVGITPPPQGVVINTSNNTIQVGSNTYTLSVSGLTKPASNLQVAGLPSGETYAYTGSDITGTSLVVTVSASMGNAAKQTLIDAITGVGGTAAEFDWADSPAMRQVVNQAMTTITANNQLDNWATAAQRAAWNQLNRGKTPSESDLWGTGYTTVVLEPYLAMNVTAFNQSGTMTASLVPSYRVVVVSTDASYVNACKNKNGFTAEGYYIAQAGRALGTPITDLTDSAGDNGVKLTLQGNANTGFTTSTVMHQDGIYAYTTTTAGEYLITRGGRTGLGTMVFNTTPALVSLERIGGTVTNGKIGTYYYDNLQAAVDDTLPQTDATKLDEITVTSAYTGSGVINVTGTARAFTIVTKGQTTISNANNNFTVGVDATGHVYTVQLQKDVAAANGNITVSSATGGSASVSTKTANVGQTITVTLSASNGYTPNGVTVRDSSGKNVSVSGSGSTYTFTMPSGSVTVTPSFSQNQTVVNPTVTVANPNRGSGTAVTTAGNNQVAPGTTVTVSTTPAAGQRTMGLSVTGATAVRTGVNQFQFTVPSGYTNVTVTPMFDVNNNTNFSDVWSSDYYSTAVAWAVGRGITNGTSTYTFGPGNACTREDMVTFLYRAAGSPAVGNVANPFYDVAPGSYYYNAVMWAVSKGITNGVSSNQFGVGQYVTRAQAVTFLHRYEGAPSASTSSGFYDVPSNEYYARAVTWAKNKGVTNGTTATTFGPNEYCERGQIVAFLYRDINNIRA